jgi:hypothetical protein
MRGVIRAIALSGVLAFPALAQDGGMADPMIMTCAEFMALDSEGQMMAIEEMDLAAEEMATDMMMPEDMASDEMKPEQMGSGEMMSEGGSMMADDKMASDGTMMSEDMVAAVLNACEGQPDKMVMDAMMEVPGN